MLNVTEGDPELRALLMAEEASGTLTDRARCMVRRSLAQGDDDEASMRGLLHIAAELHPPQAYRELLVSAVVMWALNRGDTALSDEAMAALDQPVAYVTGHIASALVALPFAGDLGVPDGSLWPLLAMGLVIMPLATWCLTTGPKLIPAPEVSLLMLIEAVFGPLIVWWALREYPGDATLIGGAIVLGALAWSSWERLKTTG